MESEGEKERINEMISLHHIFKIWRMGNDWMAIASKCTKKVFSIFENVFNHHNSGQDVQIQWTVAEYDNVFRNNKSALAIWEEIEKSNQYYLPFLNAYSGMNFLSFSYNISVKEVHSNSVAIDHDNIYIYKNDYNIEVGSYDHYLNVSWATELIGLTNWNKLIILLLSFTSTFSNPADPIFYASLLSCNQIIKSYICNIIERNVPTNIVY